jgi:hypothetical protein
MNTCTRTAAVVLQMDYGVSDGPAMVQELQDSKAAMLAWAGRDGRFCLDDLEAILQGHGESLRSWADACEEHAFDAVYSAEAVLTWLGY